MLLERRFVCFWEVNRVTRYFLEARACAIAKLSTGMYSTAAPCHQPLQAVVHWSENVVLPDGAMRAAILAAGTIVDVVPGASLDEATALATRRVTAPPTPIFSAGCPIATERPIP